MPGKSTHEELEQKVKKLEKKLSKHKQADETLYQNNEKYRNILSSIEEGYYEVDLAGNLTFFLKKSKKLNWMINKKLF